MKFGNPERFEIEVWWAKDRQSRKFLPEYGGWSTGNLKLTVGGHVLTRHKHAGKESDTVQWYLLPVFDWLASNWVNLFHEERYSWLENSTGPAATATFMAMRRFIAMTDEESRAEYEKVQAWWRRHALRAADSSALYPDVYFRRLGNDIEISWTARQPVHAPDGFGFALTPGIAILPVAEVVQPLWQALEWSVNNAPNTLDAADRRTVEQLEQIINVLRETTSERLEAGYLPARLLGLIKCAKSKFKIHFESVRLPSVPALEFFDSPVLMFGGVKPDISSQDVDAIVGFLSSSLGGKECDKLAKLVDSNIGTPISAPYEEGYELDEELIEQLDLPESAPFVDIRTVLHDLGIRVDEAELKTDSIRGVAIAGEEYSPSILINNTSLFNRTEAGRRFTLAHELFHILYDRARAKSVTHTSGPWALPGVEKRANAFAAMLLMPRYLVGKLAGCADIDQISKAGQCMRVGVSALIEHLYNLNMIDEMERDSLREDLAARAAVNI